MSFVNTIFKSLTTRLIVKEARLTQRTSFQIERGGNSVLAVEQVWRQTFSKKNKYENLNNSKIPGKCSYYCKWEVIGNTIAIIINGSKEIKIKYRHSRQRMHSYCIRYSTAFEQKDEISNWYVDLSATGHISSHIE